MTTSIGSLEVSLSLNAANFNGNIAQANRNIKAMGSELHAIKAKGTDYEKSLEGITRKQDVLSRQTATSRLKLEEMRRTYDANVASGDKTTAQLERQANAVNRAQAEYNRLERELEEVTEELRVQSSQWTQAGQRMQEAGNKMKSVGAGITSVGKDLSMKVTAPIVALGAASFKAAVDFESAFAGVRKTVDTTEEGFAKLEKGIRDMAKAGPSSATELASIMEMAGQLGIAEQNLLSFTSTISDIATATNLTAEQAATEFARFANIVQMSQEDFDKFGSTIVALGNNFATTESEIMSMSMRLAGQGAQIGMSEAQIAALATTMSSLGIEAEAGGTAMSTVLKKMKNNVDGVGGRLEYFAEAARMSTTEFADAFKKDPMVALDAFIKGLAESSAAGENLNEMLAWMGIKGIRETDTLLRMAGASDLLGKSLDLSATAWEENSALTNEAAQRYATTASQLETLKNKVVDIAITFGEILIPMVLSLMALLEPWIIAFGNLSESTKKLIVIIGLIAAAIGPVLVVLGIMISSIGTVTSLIGGWALAIGQAGGVLAMLANPIGIAIGAIALIGGALTLAYSQSEAFREAISLAFEKVKDVCMSVFTAVATFVIEQFNKIKTNWDSVGPQFGNAVANVFNAIMAVVKVVMPAIEFIVTYVWTAIKQVISGALDIIMGAVKLFSSVLTGDFGGMWDAIKQIFLGAIDLIVGWISLTFVGGIRTLITNFAKSGIQLIRGMWDDIAKVFSSSINTIVNFVKSFSTNVTGTVTSMGNSILNIFKTAWAQYATIWQSIVNAILNVIRTLVTQAINLIKNMVSGIGTALSTVKTKFVEIFTNVFNYLKGLGTTFIQIGKDIIQGLINGIGSMTSAVWEKVKEISGSIADGIKSFFGIRSPSRLMMGYGKNIGEGLSIGIAETKKVNEKTMKELSAALVKVTKDNAKEINTIASKAESDRTATQKAAATKKKEIESKVATDVQKIVTTAKSKRRKLTATESQKIQTLKSTAATKLVKLEQDTTAKLDKINTKAWSDMVAKETKLSSERLVIVKQFVEDKKSTEELSLIGEAQVWQTSLALFKEGTKERIEVQKNYKKAVEAVEKEIVGINESFLSKIQSINDELINNEKTVNDEFSKTFEDRVKALANFATLFAEFKVDLELSGVTLLGNLQGQVSGFKSWQQQMQTLTNRKVLSKTLLAELQEMGPNALSELIALNQLTDQQLTQYSALYEEKTALARKQAETELSGMKTDAQNRIKELRDAANVELESLRNDWEKQIKAISQATDTEFKSLKKVGQDAGQGLLDGLTSMEPALTNKAKSIANSIKSAITSALQIKSPSRVMIGYGKNIGEGLIQGMDAIALKVSNASDQLASAATPGAASTTGVNTGSATQSNTPATIIVQSILDGRVIGESVVDVISGLQYGNARMAGRTKGLNV